MPTNQRGFTITELIITISVAAALLSGSIFFLAAYRRRVFFQNEWDQVSLTLGQARHQSITVKDGLSYGVVFNEKSFSLLSKDSDTEAVTVEKKDLSDGDYLFDLNGFDSKTVFFSKLTGYLKDIEAFQICLVSRYYKACLDVNHLGVVSSNEIEKL